MWVCVLVRAPVPQCVLERMCVPQCMCGACAHLRATHTQYTYHRLYPHRAKLVYHSLWIRPAGWIKMPVTLRLLYERAHARVCLCVRVRVRACVRACVHV